MAGRGLLKVKRPDAGHAVGMEQLEFQRLFELLLGPPCAGHCFHWSHHASSACQAKGCAVSWGRYMSQCEVEQAARTSGLHLMRLVPSKGKAAVFAFCPLFGKECSRLWHICWMMK